MNYAAHFGGTLAERLASVTNNFSPVKPQIYSDNLIHRRRRCDEDVDPGNN